jgi:hypothetical protein
MSEPVKPLTNSLSWSAYETWTAIVLFVGTVLSRIPFRSHVLYHWDSVNFAFAMREFNLAKEQPQPPGYIVYVWLCRLMDTVVHDAQTTMVIISIGASALAVVALFCLGRTMFNTQTGLIAALFLATSPLFWFYGEIALPHSLDTLLVILSAWWLYETMRGRHRYLYVAVVILAIAGGVRQQTIVFLAPLLLFALRRVGWKRFLAAGALGAVICLIWFIPLMALSDGFATYLRVMGEFSRRYQSTTSVFVGGGWWGIRRNVLKLTMYTLFGWSATLIAGVFYAIRRLWWHERLQSWERLVFLLLWMVPALIFYVIIHMGQQGLVFVFLPALLLISAVGLERLFVTRPGYVIVATSVLVLLNVGVFCLVPEYPLGPDTQRLLTRATLINSDRYYQDRFRAIDKNFTPDSTAILAANWHHVEYYLPAYELLPIDVIPKWELGAGQVSNRQGEEERLSVEDLGLISDADGLARIIIFDEELASFNETPELTQAVKLGYGDRMEILTLSVDQVLFLGPTFGIGEP